MISKVITIACACSLVFHTACVGERPYFRDKQATLEHFNQNRALFDEAVKRCEAAGQLAYFGFRRWDAESLVWNGTELYPQATTYRVTRDGTVLAARATFEEASVIARVKPEELLWWKQWAERLQIYYISWIGTSLPEADRYVEISLRGSETRPYGFVYAPEGHQRAYEELLFESRNKPIPPYVQLLHLDGRWFYFEGKP